MTLENHPIIDLLAQIALRARSGSLLTSADKESDTKKKPVAQSKKSKGEEND